MKRRLPKRERQKKLQWLITEDPFRNDEELAKLLGVSIQTVRLDRVEMGLPEMRERTRKMAAESYRNLRAISGGDVVGVLTSLDLSRRGTSTLETVPGMGFARSSIVRGHHLFAQANSLAVALVDAPVALTALASIRFIRPVHVGDIVRAEAHVEEHVDHRYRIAVTSSVGDRRVFEGEFWIAAMEEEPQ